MNYVKYGVQYFPRLQTLDCMCRSISRLGHQAETLQSPLLWLTFKIPCSLSAAAAVEFHSELDITAPSVNNVPWDKVIDSGQKQESVTASQAKPGLQSCATMLLLLGLL